jgi:hypothetical protein
LCLCTFLFVCLIVCLCFFFGMTFQSFIPLFICSRSLTQAHNPFFLRTQVGEGGGAGQAFQVPSNLILMGVGARIWLSVLLICWGGVAASFALVQRPATFFLMRIVLGMAESGAMPGMWCAPTPDAHCYFPFFLIQIVLGMPESGAMPGMWCAPTPSPHCYFPFFLVRIVLGMPESGALPGMWCALTRAPFPCLPEPAPSSSSLTGFPPLFRKHPFLFFRNQSL